MLSYFNKCLRYWNTIRYLKFIQIFSRIALILPNSKISESQKNELNLLSNIWVKPASKSQSMVSKNTFHLLNETLEIKSNDWNNPNISKLWLYNLHYFDDLNAFNALERASWHHSLIDQWINENPLYIGNGWEPYPTSLRIVNIIKWSLNGNILKNHWVSSFEIQARFLYRNLEFHLLGNHIIANAKALIFAGLFFKGNEANDWYKKGRNILIKEINEQVLPDGGNFELSTMYHLIFLEDLLDIINIHRAFDRSLPDEVTGKIPMMLGWIKTMCHPDGEISFFNDAAIGVTPSVKEIENYAKRLNFLSPVDDISPKQSLISLKSSGYSRVGYDNLVAFIDRASIGPDYIPAHAHADTLSFELSLFQHRLIVNSGTSIYEESEERHRQRGTSSHSTVLIDGINSSNVWGSFRVANRAKVFETKDLQFGRKITLSACHNGYHRIKGSPTHCRKWIFSDQLLVVEDFIKGKNHHEVDVIFPLHPLVNLLELSENKVILDLLGNKIYINFEGNGLLDVEKSSYHPEFGLSIENRTLHFRLSGELPLNLTTNISW
jgi:uncharacterized heparinase superfamily protein